MPVQTQELAIGASTAAPAADTGRRFAWLAAATALYTYALIVFGGIVRITGSGLGCGDDWPRCNGSWIPPFDFATLVEYTHRLLAAGLVLPFAALLFFALRNRAGAGFPGRGGVGRPVYAAVGLLVVQVLLGAATVKLELPAWTTVLHFVCASSILAALLTASVRGFQPAAAARGGAGGRAALAIAGLGMTVVAFGALTANSGLPPASGQPSAAAFACQGFPLCNGSLLPGTGPDGGSFVVLHWTHRMLAFLLFFVVLGAAVRSWRHEARSVARAAAASFGLVAAQIAVAAALVLLHLPDSFQALHLAVGVALWAALVVWAALARAGGAAIR